MATQHSAEEIEVTSEMIEAGVHALCETFDLEDNYVDPVIAVYRAMVTAKLAKNAAPLVSDDPPASEERCRRP